jgi:hypothetical protein
MTIHNNQEPQAEFDAEIVRRVAERILSLERERIHQLQPKIIDKIIEVVQDEIK